MSKRMMMLIGTFMLGSALRRIMPGRRSEGPCQVEGSSGSYYGRTTRYLGRHPVINGLFSVGQIALGAAMLRRAKGNPMRLT